MVLANTVWILHTRLTIPDVTPDNNNRTMSCKTHTDTVMRNTATSSSQIWKLLQVTKMSGGLCEAGLSNFLNDWINTSMKHCAARHMATAKPKTGARCPHCSRLCDLGSLDYAAIFGHMQLADRTILSSATSSSIPTDFSSSSNGECSNTTVYRRNWVKSR